MKKTTEDLILQAYGYDMIKKDNKKEIWIKNTVMIILWLESMRMAVILLNGAAKVKAVCGYNQKILIETLLDYTTYSNQT